MNDCRAVLNPGPQHPDISESKESSLLEGNSQEEEGSAPAGEHTMESPLTMHIFF